MNRLMFAACAIVLLTSSVKADELTYGGLLGEDRIAVIVRCELGELPERIKREVRIAPDTVAWSVKQIAKVRARTDDRQAAATELRTEYQQFLSGLAEFISQGGGPAVISPSAANDYLSQAQRCGTIPCSRNCCNYCDSCK